MLDNNFGGLDNYEVTEQKMLNDSDSSQHIPNTNQSLSGKQLCCMGHPVETGRAVIGLIVLFIGIIITLTIQNTVEETGLICLIELAIMLGSLVASFKIMLGGKSK